jgi:hypothetical protein|nr:MAG TPA: hypothetical protein [Caudoviricetes sp.]
MDYEEVISNFLKLTSNIESEYRIASELLEEQNQLTQDYLHKLELGKLNAIELTKVAKNIQDNRKERRKHKNDMEYAQIIVEFVQNQQTRDVLHQLEAVLGKLRKMKKQRQYRVYRFRVIDEEDLVEQP